MALPTETERAMEQMITVFHRYAGKEGGPGHRDTLSYREFHEFMTIELGTLIKNQKDPDILQKMMKSADGAADGNKDGELDFQEFINFIQELLVTIYEALGKCPAGKKNTAFGRNPTATGAAMDTFIRIFMHYAGKKGDSCQMDYTEFEEFMKTELKSFTDNQKDPNAVHRILRSVDGSVDGKGDDSLNFQEFMNLIGNITAAQHEAMMRDIERV